MHQDGCDWLKKLVFVYNDLHDGVVKAGPEAAGLVADVEVRPSLHQHPANHAHVFQPFYQRFGSVTFCYGSGCGPGSSDQNLCLTDPDADPGAQKTSGSDLEHWYINNILQR